MINDKDGLIPLRTSLDTKKRPESPWGKCRAGHTLNHYFAHYKDNLNPTIGDSLIFP